MTGIEALIPIAVQALTPILLALASWAALKIKDYTASKTKNEAVNNAIAHITNSAETIVKQLEQEIVPYYVRNSVDGKLTKDQRDAIKKIAMDRLKKQVPITLQTLAGIAVSSVTDLMSGKIDKAVQEMNTQRTNGNG